MTDDSDVDEVFAEFEDTVNMSPGELRDWKESDNFEAYAERKSGGQPPEEPVDDVIQLLETPKSEWEDTDDGFNEVKEANEVLAFTGRMTKVNRGEPIPGTDPPMSKAEASLLSWGLDEDEDQTDFVGDR